MRTALFMSFYAYFVALCEWYVRPGMPRHLIEKGISKVLDRVKGLVEKHHTTVMEAIQPWVVVRPLLKYLEKHGWGEEIQKGVFIPTSPVGKALAKFMMPAFSLMDIIFVYDNLPGIIAHEKRHRARHSFLERIVSSPNKKGKFISTPSWVLEYDADQEVAWVDAPAYFAELLCFPSTWMDHLSHPSAFKRLYWYVIGKCTSREGIRDMLGHEVQWPEHPITREMEDEIAIDKRAEKELEAIRKEEARALARANTKTLIKKSEAAIARADRWMDKANKVLKSSVK